MSGCYFREEPNMGLNMTVSKFRCYTQLHNIQQTFFLDLGLMVNSSVPWLAMTLVTFHLKNVAITLRIFFFQTLILSQTNPYIFSNSLEISKWGI